MNEFLLKLLDLFKWVYKLMGVNYTQLRAIVQIKLAMDNRRQIMSYRKKDNQEPSNTFIWTMFFYGLFGGFIALGLYGIPSFMLSMLIFFSYLMVMIAMTLITDFSSILLDTSDNTIILPRPVDSRTLFAARITHIILYLGQITVGLSAIPAIVVLMKFGVIIFFIFLFAAILSVITAIFITNTFYLLILQFANEEKLKNVINYFQIVMAVLIMGGYQFLPRMASRMDFQNYSFEIQWWSFLTPPMWMAGAMEMFHLKTFDTPHLGLTACALTIPLLGFYLVNKYLTPVFTRKLGVMATETKQEKPKTERESLSSKISGWLTSNAPERGAFELIYHLLGRDRKIKLKIYPSFGYVIIFGLIFVFKGKEDFITTWNNLPDTEYYLLLLYLCFMILQVAIHEVPYSDDFKASWVYFSTPLKNPGVILLGTLKAIVVRLFIPGYLLVCLIVVAIWGSKVIDDIIFGLFNNLLMLLILVLINKRTLPFSMEPNLRTQAGSFIRSIILVILVGALGFAHYLLGKNSTVLLSAIPVQAVMIYFLYTQYRKTTWSQITL